MRKKIIHLLKNYNSLKSEILIHQDNISFFKNLLNKDDLSEYDFLSYESKGMYDNSSIVEKEALYKENLSKLNKEYIKIQIRKEEAQQDFKKRVIFVIDLTLSNIKKNEKYIIELMYFYNFDIKNVLSNYNKNKKYAIDKSCIYAKSNKIINNLVDKLKNNPIIILYNMDLDKSKTK